MSHIAEGFEKTAFQSMEIDDVIPETIELSDDVDDEDEAFDRSELISEEKTDNALEEATTVSDKERYMLWHRRFAHLGPKKIRNLHKVTALAKPV